MKKLLSNLILVIFLKFKTFFEVKINSKSLVFSAKFLAKSMANNRVLADFPRGRSKLLLPPEAVISAARSHQRSHSYFQIAPIRCFQAFLRSGLTKMMRTSLEKKHFIKCSKAASGQAKKSL